MKPYIVLVAWTALVFGAITNAGAGSTITVTTNSLANTRDNDMSLDEALKLARGFWDPDRPDGNVGIYCFTSAEHDKASGVGWVVVVPNPDCSYNPGQETRYKPISVLFGNPNVGLNYADDIVFASNIGQIDISTQYILLDRNDDIDGNRNPGRVVFSGNNSPGVSGLNLNSCCLASGNQVRNLVIHGFAGHGIDGANMDGALFQNLEIYENGGDGIHLVANFFAGGAGTSPRNVQFGGTSANQANWIYDNGGAGIRVLARSDDNFGHGNYFYNNTIGLIDDIGSNNHGNDGPGIELNQSRGNTIGGTGSSLNVIGHNGGPGILMTGGNSTDNQIHGNLIGTSRTIFTARPNARGIEIASGAHDNHIGSSGAPNTISGNTGHGVLLGGGNSFNNEVAFNRIGTTPNGNGSLPNQSDGIAIGGGADSTSVHDNVIAYNVRWGIYLPAANANVANNRIGLRLDGNAAGNQLGGIWVLGSGSTIGAGNQIGSNVAYGVVIDGDGADNTLVKGNFIGVTSGGVIRANSGPGVAVVGGADGNRIGTTTTADRNIISGNSGAGVLVQDGGTSNTEVIGNYIGTDAAGAAARANTGDGVRINTGPDGTKVDRNVISGNAADGVKFVGVNGGFVRGNYIGINAAGTAAVPNAGVGVTLIAGAQNIMIGGGTLLEFNAIAGNANYGVFMANSGTNANSVIGNFIGGTGLGNGGGVGIFDQASNNQIVNNFVLANTPACGVDLVNAGTTGNSVRGNTIGIDNNGAAAPNSCGVRLYGGANANTIGGPNAADRNTIANSVSQGVGLYNTGTSNNIVRNNYIGTDTTGALARGNAVGVVVQEGASSNIVRDNLISGNVGDGVLIQNATTTSNTVIRNVIGSNLAFAAGIPNGGHGIRIDNGANGNAIGSTALTDFNLIGFNTGDGIAVLSGVGNSLRYNRLASNGGLGIDLANNGVSANDAGDGDTGPNDLQNYPSISNVLTGSGSTTMTLTLNSTPNTNFTIDVYRNYGCDASGYGEADGYAATFPLTTTGSGTIIQAVLLPVPDTTTRASWGVATAQTVAGSTSELSACRQVSDVIFKAGFGSGPTGQGVDETTFAATMPASLQFGGESIDATSAASTDPQDGLVLEAFATALDAQHVQLLVRIANRGVRALPPQRLTVLPMRAVMLPTSLSARGTCQARGDVTCDTAPLAPGAIDEIVLTVLRTDDDALPVQFTLRTPDGVSAQTIAVAAKLR